MKTTINGLTINYSVQGQGEPIVLLHGWGGSIESLTPLQAELANAGYNVYNFDLPGFGKSSVSQGEFSLSDYADVIESFIESQNLKSVTLFGHSFGGSISIKIASRKKIDVKQLILCNSSGIRLPLGKKARVLGIVSLVAKSIFSLPILKQLYPIIRKFFYYYILRNRDYIDHQEVAEVFKTIVKEDVTPDLKNIDAPTLLLWGELDKDTPPSFGKIMSDEIRDSQLRQGYAGRAKFDIVPGFGHGLPLQEPKLVAKKVIEFLRT